MPRLRWGDIYIYIYVYIYRCIYRWCLGGGWHSYLKKTSKGDRRRCVDVLSSKSTSMLLPSSPLSTSVPGRACPQKFPQVSRMVSAWIPHGFRMDFGSKPSGGPRRSAAVFKIEISLLQGQLLYSKQMFLYYRVSPLEGRRPWRKVGAKLAHSWRIVGA